MPVVWKRWARASRHPGWLVARCVALRVRCPGPLGTCSPVCPRLLLCWVCGVLGHLAPVHRCARSVCCFACAVSGATWLLFTGVPAWCVALRVRCPGPLGSCSPVCLLGVSFCLCGVLGHLAPVHRCARSVRCLCLRCRGPLGSCSGVCPLAVLCCVCGVLGHLALVHRCARPVCCAVSWASWLLFTVVLARCVVLWGACSGRRCGALTRPFRTVAIRSRQGPGTLWSRTPPSGRRLFVAGRDWVPSGRTRVHPDGGGSVADRGWVRCRARTRSFRRRLVLLGTCPHAVVRCPLCALSGCAALGGRRCLAPVAVTWLRPAACLSGVPRGPAWCAAPRPARSLSVLRSAFPTPWCLFPPRRLAPPALLAGCAGHAEAGREPGSLCLQLAPAEAGAPARSASYPSGAPRWGCSGGSLRRRCWAACAAVVGVCGPGH